MVPYKHFLWRIGMLSHSITRIGAISTRSIGLLTHNLPLVQFTQISDQFLCVAHNALFSKHIWPNSNFSIGLIRHDRALSLPKAHATNGFGFLANGHWSLIQLHTLALVQLACTTLTSYLINRHWSQFHWSMSHKTKRHWYTLLRDTNILHLTSCIELIHYYSRHWFQLHYDYCTSFSVNDLTLSIGLTLAKAMFQLLVWLLNFHFQCSKHYPIILFH